MGTGLDFGGFLDVGIIFFSDDVSLLCYQRWIVLGAYIEASDTQIFWKPHVITKW